MKIFRFVVAILAVIFGFVAIGAGCYYVNSEGAVGGLSYAYDVVVTLGYTTTEVQNYLTYTMISTVLTGVFILISGVFGVVVYTEKVDKIGYDVTNTILAFAAAILCLVNFNAAVIHNVYVYFLVLALAFGICYLIMLISGMRSKNN